MARPRRSAKGGKKKGHRCGKGKYRASGRRPQRKVSRTGHRKGHPREGGSRSGVRRRRSRKNPDFELPRLVPEIMENINFSHYIRKVMKENVKTKMGMNRETVEYMDMLMKDTLHHIATTASTKMGRRKILQPLMIKKALKKIMPKGLVEKADRVGQRALDEWKEQKATKKREKMLKW